MTVAQVEQWLLDHDARRLQRHFTRVEQRLRGCDVSHLPPHLQAARLQNIQYLHEYAARGIFPHNPHWVQQPCFVDAEGRACAVAHLLLANGQDAAVKQIVETENDAFVPEMRSPLLADWIAESGFTAQEVTRIQPSYAPTSPELLTAMSQVGSYFSSIGIVIHILAFAATLIGGLNVALLLRRRLNWRPIISGIATGGLLLLMAVYVYGHLDVLGAIQTAICNDGHADCRFGMVPADGMQASWVSLVGTGLMLEAFIFALVALIPSLVLFRRMRKKQRAEAALASAPPNATPSPITN